MKKLFSVVMLAVMLATLLFGAAVAEAVDVTGMWVLTAVEMQGVQLPASLMGVTATMELHADGTSTLVFGDEAESGSWVATANGIALTDGAGVTDEMVLRDGTFVMTDEANGISMIFTRDGVMPAATEAPAADGEIELLGPWALSSVSIGGAEMPSSLLGVEMSFILYEDHAAYSQTNEGETLNVDVEWRTYEAEGAEFVELFMLDEAGAETSILVVKVDGIRLSIDAGDGVVMYFAKQEEAE